MKVCFLSGLKEVAGSQEVTLDYRGRLSGLLAELCDRYGQDMQRRLMDPDDPGVRNAFLKILVDGEDVREEDPELTGSETVFLFLPIAGG